MAAGSQTHRPIAQLKAVANPTVINLTSPATANDEFSYTFTTDVKRILIRCRENTEIKMNFTSIDTSGEWITLKPRAVFSDWGLRLNGVTIYFKANESSQIIEMLTWV